MALRYWVGGTASWDNVGAAKWALTSGGTGGESPPTSSDDVFFDAASAGANVQLDTATAVCKTLTCTGFVGSLTGSIGLEVYGNMTLSVGMAFSHTGILSFKGSATLTTAGQSMGNSAILITSTFTLTLADNLLSTGTTGLAINGTGTFNANNKTVTISAYSTAGSTNSVTTMGSGLWTITGTASAWDMSGTTPTVTQGTANLKFTNSAASTLTFVGGGKTYNNIWFARGASGNPIVITGSNTFADFKDTGTAAHNINFTAGINTTFTTWTVSGTAGNEITINSTTTATHTLTCASGIISSNYLNIQHSVATGGATFYAGAQSTDNQAVATAGSGWSFVSYITSTTSDTVTDTDAVTYQLGFTQTDTITDTDSIGAIKSRYWTNTTKHTSTWTNLTKT